MRIGYLECFAGISGDMLMGALVDAGAPVELLQRTTASLALGAELRVTKVNRSGIQSTKIDVMVGGQVHEPAAPSGPVQEETKQGQEGAPGHGHHHDHHHPHDHAHSHEHTHNHESHQHDHGRSLPEIRSLLMRAELTKRALDLSLTAFGLLAEAEGRIHGIPAEEVHFHEVGGIDAIARHRLLCRSGGCNGPGSVVLLPGECGEWFCQLRPWTLSRTGPSDRGVAEEPANLFSARAGGTGHAYRRGVAARPGLPIRCHPGAADPGDRLRCRYAGTRSAFPMSCG